MKKINFVIRAIIIILVINIISVFGQDAIFYERNNYSGTAHRLYMGQSFTYQSGAGDYGGSFRILNPKAAIKISRVNLPYGVMFKRTTPGRYPWLYLYADSIISQSYIEVGTDQYNSQLLKVECLQAKLPQPDIFIPFDLLNRNPNAENDHYLPDMRGKGGHKVLSLRKAFLWENSEDLGGWHGPYADVKIGVCQTDILQYKNNWDYLAQHPEIWCQSPMLRFAMELPGPIWSGYAPIGFPDPYDEWIDGPFGCIYSRMVLWDWDENLSVKEVIPIVFESDATNPNDLMGVYPKAITRDTKGEILFKVRVFGWVILENITLQSIILGVGFEPIVDVGHVYWYGGWDGLYPEEVYGPTDPPAIPDQLSPGSQFRPFTDAQFWTYHNDPRFDGKVVGLLGNKFPKGVYDRARTYMVIDKDKPAVFGR